MSVIKGLKNSFIILGIYIRQLLIITLTVFNKILSAITIGLKIFPFSTSIILTSFNYSTLAIIITSTIYFSYLIYFILLTLLLLNGI